jgi:hypothetical protein
MPAKVEIVTTLQQMIASFAELEHAPGFQAIGRLEAELAGAFEASQEVVHVITGDLRLSGTPHTTYDGTTWSGGIDYDRNPGIFELARGDEPTVNHPEGGHADFLNAAVDPFVANVDNIVNEIFNQAFGPG